MAYNQKQSCTQKRRNNRALLGASMLSLVAVACLDANAQETVEDADDRSETERTLDTVNVIGSFIETGASSATKVDLSVLDTPFSVSAYSEGFMKAVETTSVSDLYKYMNGVQRAGNTGYDITIRGFKAGGNDRGVLLTDGLPGLTVRFGSPPTVGVDRIELVKGPTSVLYGQGQPGGFINIISKKPLDEPQYQFTLRANAGIGEDNQANGLLGSVDFTGPIGDSDRLRYRFVGEVGDGDGFRDFAFERPVYAAPSLAFDLTPDTTVLVSGEYRKVKTHYDNLLVAPNRDISQIADIDTSYQSPSDYLEEKGAVGTISLDHRFTEDWKINLAYKYVDHTDDAFGFDSVGFRNPTTLRRRARGQHNERTYSFGEANLTGEFETFGLEHKALFGASYGIETSDFARLQFYNAPATGPLSLDINIYHPVHNELALSAYPTGSLNRRFTERTSTGFYASDLIELTDWLKVMGGVRYAKEEQFVEERLLTGVPDQNKSDDKWLPLAGLIIQPNDDLSFYASYSTSYVPVGANSQDIFGRNPFDPTLSDSIEAGVKADLFDKKLFVTAAVFEINKQDTINTFTCPTTLPAGQSFPVGVTTLATGTCSAPIGAEQSKGFELEFDASPLPNWQIVSGYTYTDAIVKESNDPLKVGAELQNAPKNTFNVWSRYDFVSGPLANLGIGLGYAYIGDRVGFLPTAAEPTNLLDLPSYQTVDLGLYYTVAEDLDLTFKITNLFDERYIESAGFVADIQLSPGVPRFATFTVRKTF
jgi:iron complex outermembrane receptor protein